MLAIQIAIGATNDVTDAERDAAVKPGKPIPAGLVGSRPAAVLAVAALATGLGVAATVSPGALALAAAGAAAGLAYDLRLKGTLLAWLPFAVGIPLLPLFAWWGARQELPPALLIAAALAIPAGAALAIANALPDLERDGRSGVRSVATILGRRRASRVMAALQLVAAAGAVVTYIVLAGPLVAGPLVAGPALAGASLAGLALAGAIVLLGLGVVLGSSGSIVRRQRGWEVQAVALAFIAASWLGGIAGAGRL
jgi:4-hydroxybenzoate polyprenyltransferase